MQYIDQWGKYYTGDRVHQRDIEVPPRPSDIHSWNGKEWIEDQAKIDEKLSEEALVNLKSLDEQSIRPLRSALIAIIQGTTPDSNDIAVLSTLELGAKTSREKVKK